MQLCCLTQGFKATGKDLGVCLGGKAPSGISWVLCWDVFVASGAQECPLHCEHFGEQLSYKTLPLSCDKIAFSRFCCVFLQSELFRDLSFILSQKKRTPSHKVFGDRK